LIVYVRRAKDPGLLRPPPLHCPAPGGRGPIETMPPPLLRTYEEARLLLEAKGWGLTKAAEHLSALPELKAFDLSQPTLSRRTRMGASIPIEPEVGTAITKMETWNGSQRRTEIVEAGLRAVHGEPPMVDARGLALALLAQFPTNELALKMADAVLDLTLTEPRRTGSVLDTVACAIADRLRDTKLAQELGERLDRFSVKHVAVAGGVGSIMACIVGAILFFAIPGRSQAAPPTPVVIILVNAGADGSAVRFETGSLVAMAGLGEKAPLDQAVPPKPLPGQRAGACDARLYQVAINGGCWVRLADAKPPCGPYFRHADSCYAPVAADPPKPVNFDSTARDEAP